MELIGAQNLEPCDYCVIGTGAAGGILAYRLAEAGLNVVSLEQGASIDDRYFTNELRPEQELNFGITPDAIWDLDPGKSFFYSNGQAHGLYARADEKSTSAASDRAFVNLQIFRLNGKLNLWNAVTLRHSRRDFRGTDHGDGDVNWPISYDDLDPYYGSVEKLIGVCGTHEGLEEVPDAAHLLPPLPLRPADRILKQAVARIRDVRMRAVPIRRAIETRREHDQRCRGCGECIFGCTSGSVYKFSSRLLPRIAGRSNYRLLCGVKVRRLIRDAATNRIAAAECIDTDTGQTVRIEARNFILCCGALETPRVLFNSRDEAYPDGLGNRSGLVGCYLQDKVKTVLGTSLLRLVGSKQRYPLGSSDAMMIPRFLFDNRRFRGGFMYNFSHFLPRRPYYLEGIDFVPGWLKPFVARLLFRSYVALMCFGKAEARRSNRVVPSAARDRYGVPQVDVEYTFSANDHRMQDAMIEYGRRILRQCSGLIVKVYPEMQPGRSIHYAGTCRMAATPADGVVDVNLRSFDHPNLYVCDGSVVPEVAEKNVTLTIMALADRLAHFLASHAPNP